MTTPAAPAELFVHRPGSDSFAPLTSLNKDLLGEQEGRGSRGLHLQQRDGREIEAFLTKPATLDARERPLSDDRDDPRRPARRSRARLQSQVRRSTPAHGWAALMVNYRGSTGYGQALSNAIAHDQNGGEAKDVLAGVDAALEKYPWLDANGSASRAEATAASSPTGSSRRRRASRRRCRRRASRTS